MRAKLISGFALACLLSMAATAPASHEANLAGAIAASGSNSIFAVAVKETGLYALLQGKGPVTVFAPTDAAFDRIGDDQVRAIVQDKARLRRLVLAHVITGQWITSKNVADHAGRDLQGFRVTASKDGLTIGGARIVKPDTLCTNGILHQVDRVLTPVE